MNEQAPATTWTVDEEDDRAILMETIAQVDREGFTVDTAEKAAWLTSRIAFHEAETERIREAMEREANRHKRAAEGLRERFLLELEAFARNQIQAEGGKRQKVILPNGIGLAFRRIPDGIAVQDEEATLEWAETENPGAVRRSLRKAEISSWWKSTGEIPPGCEVQRDRVGFYIQA